MSDSLEVMMHRLRLPAMAENWKLIDCRDPEQYLTELLTLELKSRKANKVNKLVKAANFTIIKTLSEYEWNENIEIPDGLSRADLYSLRFLEKKENLILIGAVGTGKTHLATALAFEACQQGHEVRFYNAMDLANELQEKSEKGELADYIKSMKKVELIVIDEVGFLPLQVKQAQLLFQLISRWYENKSLIITSNLEFSQWASIFQDGRLSAALIDRLVHHSHILLFSGESRRLSQVMARQKS